VNRNKAETRIARYQESLLQVNVSVARCADCPLRKTCREANDEDDACRLTSKAMAEFEEHALKCAWILTEDMPGVRALGSIHASMILAEEFFREYGAIAIQGGKKGRSKKNTEDENEENDDAKGQPFFTPLHTQYVRLQEKFQAGLERYGLTPSGRRALRAKVVGPTPISALEQYVEAKYEVKDAGSPGEGEHRRFLPGSTAPEPAAPGHSGSAPASDLRSSGNEGSEAPLPGDDRRSVSVRR